MSYLGDIRLGNTIDFKFTTRQVSGAPFTLAGSPVVSAYVGNGTTEITAGITLTVDFDSRTGLNNVRVVASGGNGFAAATDVELVLTAGTVNSVSVVGEVVGSFSIENRSALMPTTAARTLDVSATGEADANIVQLLGSAIATPTTAGVLEVDVTHWIGTAAATPTVAGVPEVDVTHWRGTAAAAPTVAGVPAIEVIDISAAGQTDIRTAVGLGSANLDTQLDALPTAAENADSVWDEDATGHQTQGSFGQAIGDPIADTNTIYKAVVTDASGATVGVDVVAVKTKTDSLTFSVAGQVDSNIQYVNDVQVTGDGQSGTEWGPV